MAKIKFGLIVSEGRGAVGGVVLSRNKSGAYMRKNTSPINPQTAAQTAVRAIFSDVTTSWRGLTDSQRLSWQGAAASGEWDSTDSLGQTVRPSGQQLFMRLNSARLQEGDSLLTSAPVKVEFPTVTFGLLAVVVAGELDDLTASIASGSLPAGFRAQFYLSPVSSPGVIRSNYIRKIGSVVTGDFPESLTTAYIDIFGITAAAGQVINGEVWLYHIASGERIIYGKFHETVTV